MVGYIVLLFIRMRLSGVLENSFLDIFILFVDGVFLVSLVSLN